MKNVWIAGIVAAAIATPAMAADMGLPLKAPPVPYVSDWSGWQKRGLGEPHGSSRPRDRALLL